MFEEAGCKPVDQPIDHSSGNVVCTLPGETGSEIVVGGHFDFAGQGYGIVDDWSGAALLPSLYQTLKSQPRHHTFVLVSFGEEERGLFGSRWFVKHLSPGERADILAFMNLECLGLGHVNVWTTRSTKSLVLSLNQVAHALSIPLFTVNVDRVGDDDTHPFLGAKIPVLSIHSITEATLPVLHSPADRLSAVKPGSYYESYRLVAFYLAWLDAVD